MTKLCSLPPMHRGRLFAYVILSSLLVSSLAYPVSSIDEEVKTPGAFDNLYMLSPIEDYLSGGVLHRLMFSKFLAGEAGEREVFGELAAPSARPSQPVAFIPYRSPTEKFSRNIIVTYDLGGIPFQNEPTIAVNPLDAENVVIGSHDYDTACVVSYVSFDGGETWFGPFHTSMLPDDSFCSDPVLAFDREGNLYYAYLSIGVRPLRVGNLVFIAAVSSAVVSVSRDGGLTWSSPRPAAVGLATPQQDRAYIDFIDKLWMGIGPNPEDPSKDIIYVTYTNFRVIYPYLDQFPFVAAPFIEVSINLVKSTDGGETWSEPVRISPVYRYFSGELDRPLVQGSNIAVAKDGTLYVAYYDSMQDGPFKGLFTPYVVVSKDGGESFEGPYAVVPGGMWEQDFFLKPTYFRSWSSMFPFIDVSPFDSREVYIVFGALGEKPGDNSDVFFAKSTDGGVTWSEPKRLNDDPTMNNQFFPTLTVSPNGTIHVMWGDMRDDPNNYRYNIYYTRSGDGGETWLENSRVSDFPSNPGKGIPIFIGDYWGIAAGDNDVYLAWTDSRAGEVLGRNQDIAFARIRSVSRPSITISPPEGPAGQVVTILGHNFAPRQREVFIEIDGVVVSSVATDDNGRFTAQIFIPLSGEGPHTVRAIDVLGNVATANFYTSFGFNTVEEVIDTLADELQSRLERLNTTAPQLTPDEIADILASRIKPMVTSQPKEEQQNISMIVSIAAAILAASAIILAVARRRR
ncbi:MAG TPA: hypothetical protein EYP20_00660 [Aigarchaeota archaeon]|nr:hypothetical protein [Aigarchaeota archaeon]